MSWFAVAVAAFCSAPLRAAPIIFVTSPNAAFNVVHFINQNDPANDAQTGQADCDIVGNSLNPGFLTAFDDTDLYYRVRLGATDYRNGSPVYAGYFWIGVDGNSDGALDIFIGIDNQGSNRFITFQAAGTGFNNSPNTTSIATVAPGYSVAQTATNYNYQPVNSTMQPGITNTDMNAAGGIDAFLTIKIPFAGAAGTATLQGAMAGLAGITITTSSPLGYVIATSTQRNSLNQDIGGVDNKTMNKATTWTNLGGISPLVNLDGTLFGGEPVPEPGPEVLIAAGLALILIARVRTRRP